MVSLNNLGVEQASTERPSRIVSAQSIVDRPNLSVGEIVRRSSREVKSDLKKLSRFSKTQINDRLSNIGRNIGTLRNLKPSVSDSKKQIKRREFAAKNLLKSIGAIPGQSSQSGPGRPKGSYKYGIPIQQYKKLQAQRKALYSQYAKQQEQKLAGRGFTPQQVEQLQTSRTVSQPAIQLPDQATDELQFQRFLAQNTVTPNTQMILDNLKRTQNKAITDDINQQRVHRERKMVNEQQSLLKARNLFGPDSNKFNVFDDRDNMLKAPNIFALSNQRNVFAPTGRPSILDDNVTGARLKFF